MQAAHGSLRVHRARREAGQRRKLSQFINLYGCEIGDETKIGAFVEIQKNATIGKRCKISSHTFVCEGVDDRGQCFYRSRRDLHQRSYPRAQPLGRPACRPKPTGKSRKRW